MAGHQVSAPLSPFHNRTHPVVEPAHLWTLGWLVNGAKSSQMIKKHDLRHWFHGRIPCVRTTVPVPQQDPSRCGTGPLVDPWLTCKWCKSCQMIKKHDLRHWFHGRTPYVRTTVLVPQQDPSRCGTGPLVDPWLTWQSCQKLPNDYRAWFETLVPWPDTMCPHHCPGSTTGPIPLWNRPTCGPLADL